MRKIQPVENEGIEYVVLSSLPFEQLITFRDWVGEANVFRISNFHSDSVECVTYELYEFWFDIQKEEADNLDVAFF